MQNTKTIVRRKPEVNLQQEHHWCQTTSLLKPLYNSPLCFLAVICFLLPTKCRKSQAVMLCLLKPAMSAKENIVILRVVILILSCVSLSGCSGLTGETPQRLLRDTVKDASEKAKVAAKSLASAASVPQKPQQYVWRDSAWRTGQVTWTQHKVFLITWSRLKFSGIWSLLISSIVFRG